MSSIALISWIKSYHRRIKSNISSHGDQIDMDFIGRSAGFNQESKPPPSRYWVEDRCPVPSDLAARQEDIDKERRNLIGKHATSRCCIDP